MRPRKGSSSRNVDFMFTGAVESYEKAVSEDQDDPVPLAMRTIRARQALELAWQGRHFLKSAMAMNPSMAGPLGGGLTRKLHLINKFSRRAMNTYMYLRAQEEDARAGKIDLGKFKDAFKAAKQVSDTFAD